jgi:hypothetical protein
VVGFLFIEEEKKLCASLKGSVPFTRDRPANCTGDRQRMNTQELTALRDRVQKNKAISADDNKRLKAAGLA